MDALTCEQALPMLDDARAGILERETERALAAHLADCDACRAHAQTTRHTRSLLGGIEMAPALAERLAAVLEQHLSHQLRVRTFETPLGWGALAYSDNGIVLVRRSQAGEADVVKRLRERLGDLIRQERPRDDIGLDVVQKLIDYHQGRRVQFDEPLDLSLVPPFTRQVLRATARIPYGEVRPYAWVARQVGRPKAARAVGQALHINPVAPIIPCHRVIASNDTLGGYGGGLEMKEWLLRLEGYLS
jgi:methylated-DNA-[protein]-cysteine S-methyltransferase